MNYKGISAFTLIMLMVIDAFGQHPLPLDSAAFVDTHVRPIVLQKKQTFHFDNGIYFSNQFDGARLNGISQVNDSVFTVLIIPENSPINASPWYAFKVWSTQSRTIKINMTYDHGKHRYHPKTSRDKKNWSPIGKDNYLHDSVTVFFRLSVSTDTTWVAAQPILTSTDALQWSIGMAENANIQLDTVGYSVLNRPLLRLSPVKPRSKEKIIVISRQHPPETTGYMAMKTFVATIWSNAKLAKRFRKKFDMIVYPMLNPDGVDLGHWRHNVGGIDLNRDWHFYRQPEIKAVTEDIKKIIAKPGTRVVFGGDFHSTWSDLYYTNENDSLAFHPDLIPRVLDKMRATLVGFTPDLRPGGNLSPTSKSWFYNFLHASAVTYEVGDKTPEKTISLRAKAAANAMMSLLLEKN